MAIVLTNNDDTYTATVDVDTEVQALAGNDSVTVRSEKDVVITLTGGLGNDLLTTEGRDVRAELYGNEGDDTLFINESFHPFASGGAGDDYIRTEEGGFIYGDDGNDVLDGGYITESFGGAGDDIIYGYVGYGEAGSDIIYSDGDGGAGDDKVYGEFATGGAGDDELLSSITGQGDDGYDLMGAFEVNLGGAGKDVFFPFDNLIEVGEEDGPQYISFYDLGDFEPGTDKIAAPFYIDVVDAFSGRRGEALFDEIFPGQYQMLIDRDGDMRADIGWYTGLKRYTDADFIRQTFDGGDSDVDDVRTGTARNELMVGRDGDDNLDGAAGRDWLFGGFGKDTLNGGAGDDLLVGNAGADSLYGGSGHDEMRGGDGNDLLSASAGNDRVDGGDGEDRLAGGDGNDMLVGGEGKDRLNGGDGDDILIGGSGADYLLGGEGSDIFVFAPGDSGVFLGERDHVGDFTKGEDKLDLTAFAGATIALEGGMGETLVEIYYAGEPDFPPDLRIRVSLSTTDNLDMADILI